MKMYIPEIGDKIVLSEDWTFRLFDEGRNSSLFTLLNVKARGAHFIKGGKKFYGGAFNHVWGWHSDDGERLIVENYFDYARGITKNGITLVEDQGTPVTLKAGQVLSVDRVYIRRGAKDYSSVTFNYIGAPKGSGRIRFWAKLDDVNNIIFEKD